MRKTRSTSGKYYNGASRIRLKSQLCGFNGFEIGKIMTFRSKVKLGFSWVADSLELFKQHPAKWMALSSLYLVFFQFLPILLLGIIEQINQAHGSIIILFFVGLLGLALTFSWPIFTSLVIGVCRETHAERVTPVSDVFHRVKPHVKQLVFLGVAFFIYRLIMIGLTENDIQALDIQQMDKEVMPIGFWWLMLKLLVLQVPLLLATWYSPLLISYHQYSVFKSIGHSVWAALHNITALITAWVTLTLAVVGVMLVLGLVIGLIAIFAKGLAAFLGMLLIMFVSLMATAFLFSIQYFSFLSMYYKKGEDFVS
jgi:hypothetical protein